MRNKKNRYGMPKQRSGRRFRAEKMNIFGMRKTTEFSMDEVRGRVRRMAKLTKLHLFERLWGSSCFFASRRRWLIERDSACDRLRGGERARR